MNYWVRTLERMESALPKLLHKGGWKGIVRGGTHRAHRIFKVHEGFVVSIDRYIPDSPKRRFPWLFGPVMGRVLEGSIAVGISDAVRYDRRFPLPRRIRENGLFTIGKGQTFFIRPAYVATRSVNKAALVLLVRRLPRSKRGREAVNFYARLTRDRTRFIVSEAQRYYP